MTDTPPDRLCNNPVSPFHDEALLSRGIGIRFKGVEKHNVEEYCISEGWVRVAVGKTTDRRGRPLTMRMTGPVEAWFLTPVPGTSVPGTPGSGTPGSGAGEETADAGVGSE